ncbi:MAG: DUF2384 domain-containing protein [Legionellales bacterium]|nr:DUF2384 domain-containing protein [Legionellales bacterium]
MNSLFQAHNVNPNLDPDEAKKVFKVVVNILEKWHATLEEKLILLGLKKSTYFKYQKDPQSIKVNQDFLERLSYILNIHSALRILFSHPDSVYGWVRKPNDAPFFNGHSAMEIMLQGRVVDLWAVASRLNAERGGWA